MVWLCLVLLASPIPGVRVVEANGVRVRALVHANVYTYEVTNQTTAPIREFEIPYADGHAFAAPLGWAVTTEDGVFRAVVTENGRAIGTGETGSFSFRITTRGAVLGYVEMRLGTGNGAFVIVPHTWGAVPMPASYVLYVAGLVLALASVLTGVMSRADRRSQLPVTALGLPRHPESNHA